jgi:hypothetical protein
MKYSATEQSNTTWVITTGVIALMLLSALGYILFTAKQKTGLQASLDAERLRSESFLSEKLLQEKDNANLREDFEALTQSGNQTRNQLKETQSRLSETLERLDKARRSEQNVEQLKKQLLAGNASKADLERQLISAQNSLSQLSSSGKILEDSLANLQEHVERLLARSLQLQQRAMDNTLLITEKNNGNLTVRARKTKAIQLEAEIVGTIDNVQISVTTPDGKTLVASDHELTISSSYITQQGSQPFYSAASPQAHVKVGIKYIPKVKLTPGVHRIVVSNSGAIVGSLQVRLR